MGVRGLLSYCLSNTNVCTIETIDLVEIAAENNGVDLLVDFNNFLPFLTDHFWKRAIRISDNKFLPLLGGEYESLNHFICSFVQNLKSQGIHLVLYVDGAKGSSTSQTEYKLEEWKSRACNKIKDYRKTENVLRAEIPMASLPLSSIKESVLHRTQVFETLRSRCEVIYEPGEADYVIAKAFRQRPRAVAILSNDSDFCIFKGVRFIPYSKFDLDDNLQLRRRYLTVEPLHLRCGMLSVDNTKEACRQLLVNVSILTGNDFTKQYIDSDVRSYLLANGASEIEGAFNLVKQYEFVENIPIFADKMLCYPKLKSAVNYSRQFYNLDQQAECSSSKEDHIMDLARKGPTDLISMKNNFYWHKRLLEDSDKENPNAEIALVELRKLIYEIVLGASGESVIEYSWGPTGMLKSEVKLGKHTYLQHVSEIHVADRASRLLMFQQIITHLESEKESRKFRTLLRSHGLRNGLIAHSLRYMLRLNTNRNLFVKREEFLVLMVSMLGYKKFDLNFYQTLSILPNVRCATLLNWMQIVYWYFYWILGHIFEINEDLIAPREIFSGAIFTGLYMALREKDELARNGFPNYKGYHINSDYNRIMQEHETIMKEIMSGIHRLKRTQLHEYRNQSC